MRLITPRRGARSMKREAAMTPSHRIRKMAAALLSASVILSAMQEAAKAASLPTVVGRCSDTTIERIGPRLVNQPGSGSGIVYANGGSQVSYDVIAAIHRSRRGDRVRLCLVSIPKNCPPGDDRGRVY